MVVESGVTTEAGAATSATSGSGTRGNTSTTLSGPTTSSQGSSPSQNVSSSSSSSFHTNSRIRNAKSLTNTNTDCLCHDPTKRNSILSKCMYRFNLWTGLYMLNPYERFMFHLVTWTSLVACVLYLCVFWVGFVHGYNNTNSTATAATASNTTTTGPWNEQQVTIGSTILPTLQNENTFSDSSDVSDPAEF